MPKHPKRPLWKIPFLLLTGLFLILLAAYLYVAYFLPIPTSLYLNPTNLSTKILDRHGTLLYEVPNPTQGRKTYLPLSTLPPLFLKAILASEDGDFYRHGGLDYAAIVRALFFNSVEQKITSGASTITQQLVRNLLGTNRQRNLSEKLLEAIYAVRLSHLYTKDQILEQYLNTVYFGNLSYGVAEASLNYFAKDISKLDLAEISLLAGLPQSPSTYNPLVNLPRARLRQQYVLQRLVDEQAITATESDQAATEPLHFTSGKTAIEAPHFVHQILAELEDKYGPDFLYSGLTVTTTLDLNLQKKAQQIVDFQLAKLKDKHVTNSAVLSADLPTGQILVWLGSKDYFDDQIDGQVDLITSLRQPGSALKPFLYLLGLQKGNTLATIMEDLPLTIKTASGIYAPLNYDLDFHGPMRIREALANSFNIPAVRMQERIGTANFLNFLRQLGLDSLDQSPEYYGDSLTLGGGEIRLRDLANAYFTLSNYGQKKPFSDILEINDSTGQKIFSWTLPLSQNILGRNAAQLSYLIISTISDPNARLKSFGEGNVLELSVPAAAKTGTTRNFKDNWTFGFSTNLLTAVWVGNSDASAMQNISGIDGAGPIWHDFMEYFHQYQPPSQATPRDFHIPENLRKIDICAVSGLLPGPNCQSTIQELFLTGTEPRTADNYWQKFQCPSSQTQYFIVYPFPFTSWAKDRGFNPNPSCQQITFPPASTADSTIATTVAPIQIISPLPGDSFQLNPNIPLTSQQIPLHITYFPPSTPPTATADLAPSTHLQLSLDNQILQTQDISHQTTPLEIRSTWLPKPGPHTLKVTLTAPGGQTIATSQSDFLIN